MAALLTLPLEIRLQIYTTVLRTSATLRLNRQLQEASRSYYEGNYYVLRENLTLPDFQQTALLRASRQVYDEASPIFYQSNTFNFELGHKPDVNEDGLEAVAGLDTMRNISVRILPEWHKGRLWFNPQTGPAIDRVLQRCPSARSLTVHYPCPHEFHSSENPFGDLVPRILRRLDQITVVAFIKPRTMVKLGAEFGTGQEGDIQLLPEWPQISLGSQSRLRMRQTMEETKSEADGGLMGFCVGTWRSNARKR
ncbi:MAG: hypothetical protein ALECFALPRED_009752 [Alectoria fallacina]|uniref:DUF7730 domain-containing protein n=1 Tax=Alectoria fallacina TaxID=1903189 RepID=A0A8H3PK87_9LECA|nr:MAG: hypothetical protein ALECFALPRED_009752 [Alectoria fallacina]